MRSRDTVTLLVLGVLLVLAGCADPHESGSGADPSDVLVIRNGTVITATGSEPIRGGLVAIEGDRILYAGAEVDFSVPIGAQVLDAGGGSILPGFIDAHTHETSDPAVRRRFLEGGVTTVCDLGSPLSDMPQFDQATVGEEGVARGLKVGPILTAPGGLPGAVLGGELNHEVATPEESREAVGDLQRRGASVIKVYLHEEAGGLRYPMLDEATLTAIVEEARAVGLLVRADVTYASLLPMAIAAKVDSIEHVPVNSTQVEREAGPDGSDALTQQEILDRFEGPLGEMVEGGIAFVPTLDRPYGDIFRLSSRTPEEDLALAVILAIVGRFDEPGGTIALGTDFSSGTNVRAGMPIGEMEMLQAAGPSPLEIIEAATRDAAAGAGGETSSERSRRVGWRTS